MRSARYLAILLLCTVTGCAGVDRFSDRALTYNGQAEIIKEQDFLLNIMRAAYREPLQFSDFTQVTGQASVSGTAAFSLPISVFPVTAPRSDIASPSATISGNQSFTIVNLNTQDFYEGILSPIPLNIIDYYMQSDYPKALVLTLFVQRIVLQPQGGGPPRVYANSYIGDDYAKFEAVLQAAIDLGLTTETVNEIRPIGPPMTAGQLPELRYLTALGTTGTKLKTYQFASSKARDPLLTKPEAAAFKAQHINEYYRLISVAPHVHFCFQTDGTGPISGAPLQAANVTLTAAGVLRPGLALTGIKIPSASVCGGADEAPADGDASDSAARMVEFDVNDSSGSKARHFEIAITTRSVESIMYYLGEWTRAELHLDPEAAASPPIVQTDRGADILFQVGPDCPPGGNTVSMTYNGKNDCMLLDPSGADRSGQVMEIVSQLFALNNSAKDLPASSLISVLSP